MTGKSASPRCTCCDTLASVFEVSSKRPPHFVTSKKKGTQTYSYPDPHPDLFIILLMKPSIHGMIAWSVKLSIAAFLYASIEDLLNKGMARVSKNTISMPL
jgi:hypothetical protein